jgi:DNA-directed RNA polymerase subunit RPC12/RpoP
MLELPGRSAGVDLVARWCCSCRRPWSSTGERTRCPFCGSRQVVDGRLGVLDIARAATINTWSRMVRVASLVLAALVVAAAAPAAAHAFSWSKAFVSAGELYWSPTGARPACGEPLLAWVDELPGELADSLASTCAVRIWRRAWESFDLPQRCELVFHELGHLYGHEHAEGGVMSATWPQDLARFAPCDALFDKHDGCPPAGGQCWPTWRASARARWMDLIARTVR